MGKIRKPSLSSVTSNLRATVSSDDEDDPMEPDTLKAQISELTSLLEKMNTRLKRLEHEKRHRSKNSSILTPPVQVKSVGGSGIKMCEKYVLFERGDVNSKGGVYEFSHLEKVYISDEGREAIVQDETRLYAWVLVVGETSTRRKLKEKLKRLRS